ncbi:hypothetical protein A4G99_08840 [Haladaptatus sp. R4]|uniref:SHOCT domain-containing protein n=1 Tax=Haladaptatus sp. R4 TaxID=1679489 RepID=UPI0007B4F0D7|nr:SHOCT domain-containing protein [Haladaptatus sp. R4]KZN24481.1 hypothetical protein A4G99_08840 [Haladaptatus sp. R4]
MNAFASTKVKRLFAAFVVSLLTLLAIVVFGVFGTLAALGSPAYANAPLIPAFFRAAFPYVVAFFFDAVVACVFFVWMVVAIVQGVSVPRSDRLGRMARVAEAVSPRAREVGLSEHVTPTKEDRMEELKRQYVADEIDEYEFERRMMRLLDDGRTNDGAHRDTRRWFEREFEREYEWEFER